jgi:cytochrome c biogenesis protein CcmG/thiol:disulfide interchange protein DsbE
MATRHDRSGRRAAPPQAWLAFLPLVAFAALAALFFVALRGGDHSRLPSALVGKSAPAFSLPPLEANGAGLSDAYLRQGKVTLVNVFASWCVPCRDEHPVLLQLAKGGTLKDGVRLVGLAYKDEPANSRKFLGELGNPYSTIGVDQSGRVGIDWGVYGVPETFVVRGDGVIAHKVIGPLSLDTMRSELIPAIEKAMK